MPQPRFSALVPASEYGPANKYDPDYCVQVRVMATKGMFVEEWCANFGVTMSTLYNWANAHPEFEQAVHEAWWALRAYWTEKARTKVEGVGIPPTVLLKILEKRFPDTWGKNPRNTQENFADRNKTDDPDAIGDTSPEALRAMSREDLQDRIKRLEARRKLEDDT